MYPVMKSASRWNGYIFCAVLVVMMIYSLPKLFDFSRHQTKAVSLFLSGDLSREFEGVYDKDFPVRDVSVALWANLRYLMFSEGEPGVLIGRDGWLFSNEELLLPNNHRKVVNGHLQKVASYVEALTQQGKSLYIVPVPMKVTVYPEYYGTNVSPAYYEVNAHFKQGLDDMQIAHVDLLSEYEREKQKSTDLLFLKKDTHWSPYGAQVAARLLALQYPELVEAAEYRTVNGGVESYQGDLTNFLLAGERLVGDLKTAESINRYETAAVMSQASDALFGERGQVVDLVGTSYSDIEQWNFRGFLQQSLGREVDSYSLKEKGPYAAMDEYLATAINESSAQAVIWELPVRVLLTTDHRSAGWQQTLQSQF